MTRGAALILATSNGVGMGHLSRQLAVGLAAGPASPASLFSHSIALPTVMGQGLAGEYCPGPDRGWVPEARWPLYLRDRLMAIAQEVDAGAVVFDGVAPYRGIYLARDVLGDVPFVWFRRGMWRPGVNAGQLWKAELFDLVIEPGDLAGGDDRGPTASRTDAIRVPPVSLLDQVAGLGRHEAADALGLDPDRPTVLLTLGTGRLGDVAVPGAEILDELLARSDWQIAVTRSAVATNSVEVRESDRIVELRGVYPLVRYLSAFDAAVSAAGYNAVHELVSSGLPTLLVPNVDTRTDDQEARARSLGGRGLALAAHPGDRPGLREEVRRLLDPRVRESLTAGVEALAPAERGGGARETVESLNHLRDRFRPRPPTWGSRARRGRDEAKAAIKRFLGPSGTNRVRALLGRPPLPSTAGTPVTIIEGTGMPPPGSARTPLYLTDEVDIELLGAGPPVEHLLAGSSASYRRTRRGIVDRYYDVG